MDFPRAAGPGHEDLDAQDVPAARHSKDGRHPGADPFDVFGGADDPDQGDGAGGADAGGVVSEK